MLIAKIGSKIDYLGITYKISAIRKRKITLSGKSIIEIEPKLFVEDLRNGNLKILEV